MSLQTVMTKEDILRNVFCVWFSIFLTERSPNTISEGYLI